MKFQCQYCNQEHDNPYVDGGFKEYYEGLAHQKATGEILIWHRYEGWIKPETGLGFPGDGYLVDKCVMQNGFVEKGDYIWNNSQGQESAWEEILEDQQIFGGTVIARKIK